MPYEVAIKQVPAQPVASWTTRTSLAAIGADIGRGFGAVFSALGAAGAQPIGPPFIVYHDLIDERTEGTIEVCVPVTALAGGTDGEVVWKEMPGGAVAWTTHRGPYPEVGPAYQALTAWIADHGRRISGPPREIYLNDPQTVAPADLLTEVQFPVDPSA